MFIAAPDKNKLVCSHLGIFMTIMEKKHWEQGILPWPLTVVCLFVVSNYFLNTVNSDILAIKNNVQCCPSMESVLTTSSVILLLIVGWWPNVLFKQIKFLSVVKPGSNRVCNHSSRIQRWTKTKAYFSYTKADFCCAT